MTDYKDILSERFDAVLRITLNRPDRFNAFTIQMHHELNDALEQAARDSAIRAIVLTGAGKAFSSGLDLKDYQGKPGRELGSLLRDHYNPTIFQISALEKPVVCALNGVAAGGGMGLAMACDFRIASEKAVLIQAFVNIGAMPDMGSTWILPRLMGYERAFEVCSSGRQIHAEEALRLNLVLKVVPHGDLEAQAMDFAIQMSKGPSKAIALMKRALNRNLTVDLKSALDYEAALQEKCGDTEDFNEGIRAFAEKRKPVFKG